MQGLCGGKAIVPIALQSGVASGTSEHFQKAASNASVRQRDRPLIIRQEGKGLGNNAGVGFGRPRRDADGIDQHLGVQSPRLIERELFGCSRGLALRDTGELIGMRVEYVAIEMP